MNPPTLSRQQVRELDRRAIDEFGLPGIVLMENAGRGVADKLFQLGIDGRVIVCCGKGNNGGDGFVVARHLDLRHANVRVWLFADPAQLSGDAGVNYRVLASSTVPIEILGSPIDADRLQAQFATAGWIVDALLGTGAVGEPRPPYDQVIARINASGRPVVAVDLPSGLDCDTGRTAHCTIRAAHTCTFVAAKPGFFAPGADQFTGRIHVLDIGAPRVLVEQMLAAPQRT